MGIRMKGCFKDPILTHSNTKSCSTTFSDLLMMEQIFIYLFILKEV